MRLVIVEDHLSFRESLRIALQLTGGFDVVGVAASARDACRVIEELAPDVVAADLMLADTDAVALVRELRRRRSLPPTLIIARLGHPLFVRDAFEAGALGYALKDQPLAEIIDALNEISQRRRYVCPQLADLIAPGADANGPLDRLSTREREVFGRLLEGMSAKEIARALCVSVKTVNTHRLQINRKLGVKSPAQFARLTATQGFVSR
jgi:DNA-binding NarL/FixJ family response regulator